MGQYQRKHYRRKRRFRFTRVYGVISILLILAAIVAGCIVFFRVDRVEVEGNVRYTQEEIVATTGIEEGDNMFLLNKYQVIDTLLTELSYVDDVSIRRALPSTVKITVTECTAAAAVQDEENGVWWLVSSQGKLLERVDDPAGCLQVTGLQCAAPSEGTALAAGEEQRLQLDALLQLLSSMEERELIGECQSIDLSSASTVSMEYGGQLTVLLNLSSDFDYEMRVLATVMEEYVNAKWGPEDTGTLNMTLDDGLPHLIKNAA